MFFGSRQVPDFPVYNRSSGFALPHNSLWCWKLVPQNSVPHYKSPDFQTNRHYYYNLTLYILRRNYYPTSSASQLLRSHWNRRFHFFHELVHSLHIHTYSAAESFLPSSVQQFHRHNYFPQYSSYLHVHQPFLYESHYLNRLRPDAYSAVLRQFPQHIDPDDYL